MKVLIGILIVGCICIIFVNSSKGFNESHANSNYVADVISKLSGSISISDEKFQVLIRKIAHIVEYMVLGLLFGVEILMQKPNWRVLMCGYCLFSVLIIAVLDEHIQSFSDRTSSTGDIFLDFFGALIGFAFVIAIHFIYGKIKKRKERRTLVEMVLETEQKEKRG